MKTVLILLVILALLCTVVSACAESASSNRIIEIQISEESEKYRDEHVFVPEEDPRGLSEEDQLAMFDAAMLKLSAREGLSMPETDTKYPVQKEESFEGEVYSLSSGENYERIVIYIHGGAWTSDIDVLHVNYCDKLVDLLNAKVYMPLYPLAPQVTCEKSYEMLLSVYKQLLEQNLPIIVMGDSAGGNLTLGLTLMLKDQGITLPQKTVSLSPCVDIAMDNPEIEEVAKLDGMLPPVYCRKCGAIWAGDTDLENPYLSPIYGDLTGFPDSLIYVGTCELVLPDCLLFYDKLCEAGVNTTLVKAYGFWHVYPLSDVQESEQFDQILVDFVLGEN